MILVLTSGFGDGHNTAAHSVADALRKLSPGEEIEVTDLIAEAEPRITRLLQRFYQFVIINRPAAWKLAFRFLEKAKVGSKPALWQRSMANRLMTRVREQKPRLIVSTYPIYPGLLNWMRQHGRVPPIATIITDSISVHGIWISSPSDLYCVADEETRVVVEKLGAPADRIRISGFPVSLKFTESAQRPPESSHTARILYLPSTSLDYVRQTLDALRPLLTSGVELTLPLGKHADRLDPIVRPFMASLPDARITLIGWTDQMPELLQTHDLVICKAGGAILHEVLAARCPAVIDYVVPGQEEGNAEYLLSHRCALRSNTPHETADCVARLLADGGRLGREFREAMIPISLPDAAMRAAKQALNLCAAS